MPFNVEGARKAGYSDAEIASFLASENKFDAAAARKAGYSDSELIAHLSAKPPSAASQIPTEAGANKTVTNTPDPTLGESVIGAGEAALSTLTGLTGGAVGTAVGAVGGLARAVTDGTYGTPQGVQTVNDTAARGAQALTYQPRTAAGAAQTEALGSAMQQAVPLIGAAPQVSALATLSSPAAALVSPIARQALQTAAKAPQKAVQAVREALPGGAPQAGAMPTPGTMGSVGAAGTDMALLRRTNASDLPIPIDLTKGQAERTFEQQRFERETAKNPTVGGALRDRYADQNQAMLRNFDAWIDQTGAEAPDLRATGVAVDKALVERAKRDKVQIRVAYKEAEKAGELAAPVSLQNVVTYLNEAAPDAATAPLVSTARNWAVKLGIAELGPDGQLKPTNTSTGSTLMNTRPGPGAVNLKTAETFRQAINRNTDFEPTNIRQATVIKGLIDEATENAGGDLYRSARRLREQYANRYENRAVIAKLLDTKRGTQDRQVAFEDVFDHSVLRGSLDDLRTVRKVLQTGGDDGQQAWRELQGQAVNYLKEQATKNVARDERGNPIVSAAGLDRAISSLDKDGKLAFVFGRKGAEQLRALNDLAKDVYTAPPGSVNTSNTASVLLAAFDMALSGAGGMPLPVASGLRLIVNNVKDRRLRLRVNEALGISKKLPAPRQRKETLH